MKSEMIKLPNRIEWRNKGGELHREDGPAVEYLDGSKEWWINGKLHREDGPARWVSDYSWGWYLNGKPHRVDGPAFRSSDNKYQWWFKGVCYYGYHGYYDSLVWNGSWFFSLERWFEAIPDELKINYLFYGIVMPEE
jgi:hypothetical protein